MHTLSQTRDAITQLQKLPEATQTWIPIAPGAFVRGTVSPAATVLLAVGAGVAVEKSPEAIMTTLEGHEEALTSVADQALSELKEVFAEMDTIKSKVEGDGIAASDAKHHHDDHDHLGHKHPH